MKYFVTADPHGFFTLMHNALLEQGFDENNPEHKVIICGDLMDRGKEARKMQDYILSLLEKDKVILIRGNHEDLTLDMIKDYFDSKDLELYFSHHSSNGTIDTAIQLTGTDPDELMLTSFFLIKKLKSTPFIQKIIPAMLNYYETEHYVFVHGWVPCGIDPQKGYYVKNLKEATDEEWAEARWGNGMSLAVECGATIPNKTIVCGHWNTSFGHKLVGKIKSEYGDDANFSPFYADGIIALDACTAYSKQINCIVIDD